MSSRDYPRRPGQDRRAASDAERSLGTARAAATAAASGFAAARPGDWAGTPPASLAEAVSRLAYHIASGAGSAPIVELP